VKLRGLGSVAGCVLVQLVIGSYHGTFGNLLPYFTSYIRQTLPHTTTASLAQVLSVGGLAQGFASLVAGLVLIPLVGSRGCLIVGSFLLVLANLLTYCSLDWGVEFVVATYGLLGGVSVALTMVPSVLIPLSWFPDHRGKISGLVFAGFGLSASVFSGLQSVLINPSNLAPKQEEHCIGEPSCPAYFDQRDLLDSLPLSMVVLSAIYTGLLVPGLLLAVERPKEEPSATGLTGRLREAGSYMVTSVLPTRSFHLLFHIRLLLMVVMAAFLAHWKTLLYTKKTDDWLISLVGGVNGVMNCLSRLLGGVLLDLVPFPHLMAGISLPLAVIVASAKFVESFYVLLALVWFVFLLSFAHFSTIPAHAMALFQSPHGGVVVSAIGFSDTIAYAVLSLLNAVIMSDESDPDRFTWLLVTLASCSFGAGILSLLVPKAAHQNSRAQNVDPLKFKSEAKEENEIGVEINHAYEGDFHENTNTRSV